MEVEVGQIREWADGIESRRFKITKYIEMDNDTQYYLVIYLDGLNQIYTKEEILEKSFVI